MWQRELRALRTQKSEQQPPATSVNVPPHLDLTRRSIGMLPMGNSEVCLMPEGTNLLPPDEQPESGTNKDAEPTSDDFSKLHVDLHVLT